MRFSRRTVVMSAFLPFLPGLAGAAEPLRIGVLKFGTLSWEIAAMRAAGLDRAQGAAFETVELANNDAARIAFMSGAVDVIVSDWTFAARERAEGRPLAFVPFSAALGAVMVAENSPIRAVPDLVGRRIGVAGGPLDKSWIMLRAAAQRHHGIDLAKASEPVFGAPPLLSEKLRQRELDAALLFWNFAARLETEGFRAAIAMGEVEKSLGTAGSTAFVGYLFDEHRLATAGKVPALHAFLSAARATKERLRTDEAAWSDLRPLMQAQDERVFAALRRGFVAGIPTRPIGEEARDAALLYAVMFAAGGEKLMGKSPVLPPGTFYQSPASGL